MEAGTSLQTNRNFALGEILHEGARGSQPLDLAALQNAHVIAKALGLFDVVRSVSKIVMPSRLSSSTKSQKRAAQLNVDAGRRFVEQ